MKKLALYLASVLAVIAFAPEASALPLFARQTGMACSACHFQHFPMLNSFGRAFKAGAFTMMGAQSQVEGDGISIPSALNMAVLATMGYSKNNSDNQATSDAKNGTALNAQGVRSAGDGSVYVPGTNGEFSLFVGGHVSDNAGALAELGMVNDAGTGAGLSSAKMPMLWEVADATRAGLVPFTTGDKGASYGYEVLNTGANAIHTMLFVGGDFNNSVAPILSAQQYISTGTQATGATIVVNNPGYFVSLTKFNQIGPADLGGTNGALTSTYLRAAGTFDLAGWDTGVGVQSWSGTSTSVAFSDIVSATVPPVAEVTPTFGQSETKATAIDGQMQGEWNKMPLGFYVTYARAPANTSAGIDCATAGIICNAYNGGTDTRSSFNLSAELGVIPEKATIGFGIRRGKSGVAVGSSANASDNAWLIEGSFKLAQNMLLNLVYTSQSGDFWDANAIAGTGSKQTTLNLATLF